MLEEDVDTGLVPGPEPDPEEGVALCPRGVGVDEASLDPPRAECRDRADRRSPAEGIPRAAHRRGPGWRPAPGIVRRAASSEGSPGGLSGAGIRQRAGQLQRTFDSDQFRHATSLRRNGLSRSTGMRGIGGTRLAAPRSRSRARGRCGVRARNRAGRRGEAAHAGDTLAILLDPALPGCARLDAD